MDYLPWEIIEHIYSFLAYSDRLLATEICLRWHDIFIVRLIKQTVLRIKGDNIHAKRMSYESVIHRFAISDRCYPHMTLEDIDFSQTNRNTEIQIAIMMANQGLHVQSLDLINCRIPMQKLYQIMHMMNRVKTLTMAHCYISLCAEFWSIPFVPKFHNLKSIALKNIRSKNEAEVLELLLRGNHAKVDLTMDNDSIDDRTQVISSFASRIAHLSFVFYQSNTLRNVFSELEMNLETLRLKRQPHDELHSIILLEILPVQRNLKQLYINTFISTEVLQTIAKTVTGLKYLSVTIGEDDSIPLVNIYWPNLKVFYLSRQINLKSLFKKMSFDSLEELHLYTECLSKHTIVNIYEKCCRVKKLSLSALSMMRCDSTLGEINLHLTKLESLAVQCSSRTTFVPLLQAIQRLPRLFSFSIVFCEKINDRSAGCIILPFLRSLCITRNRKISAAGIKILSTNCPRIDSLTIRECPMFGDDAVEVITESLSNLTALDISNSSAITLNSIRLILTRLRCLCTLRIDDCPKILKQWRNASQYTGNLFSLRNFYHKYPEFFIYDLPSDFVTQYESDDDCFDYDSANDASDTENLDDIEELFNPLNEHLVDADNEIIHNAVEDADIIIISDNDED